MIEFAPERLIAAREHAGLRREQLAIATDLSYPFVQALELGNKTPSRNALFRLADALNVEVDALLATRNDLATAR
jgi:transcriptional regulator with XRE-family HTH domain